MTIDLATHDVDILTWIAGERPSRVYAEVAQRIHADARGSPVRAPPFPSGVVGLLDVDWLTPAKRRQLMVVGEEGMFELDFLTQRLTFTKAAGLETPRLIDGYAPTFEGDMAELPVSSGEPLAAELEAFLASFAPVGRPVVDGEDGLWAVAIANALLEAAASRAPADSDLPARISIR